MNESHESTEQTFWKKCSSCKKIIGFGSAYFTCSVSTCNTKKLGLVFCSVNCWDAHLGFANHRSADAIEEHAPSRSAFLESLANVEEHEKPHRRIVPPQQTSHKIPTEEIETLVVVSKVKKLIRDRSDFNTSECCIDALTDKVVEICMKGIDQARSAGRKTVMGRDIL